MIHPAVALAVAVLIGLVVAVIVWPRYGLYARWRRWTQLKQRILVEDALKHIYKQMSAGGDHSLASLAGVLQISRSRAAALLTEMEAEGVVTATTAGVALTPAGRETALHIIRAHRLWERHLAEKSGYKQTEWHRRAEFREHQLTPTDLDELAAQLAHPTHDPHGDPIPQGGYLSPPTDSLPLSHLSPGESARIVHIEDEPELVYAQLIAEELYPTMIIRVIEQTPQRVHFRARGRDHFIAPILANNVAVQPLATPLLEEVDTPPHTLAELNLGESAVVTQLSPACRGSERRRFLDLGILPGTQIVAELRSPGGDPTGYRIRGALIALRREQARQILIARADEPDTALTARVGKPEVH